MISHLFSKELFASSDELWQKTGSFPFGDQNGEFVSFTVTGAPENLAYASILKHPESTEANPQSGLQIDTSIIFVNSIQK